MGKHALLESLSERGADQADQTLMDAYNGCAPTESPPAAAVLTRMHRSTAARRANRSRRVIRWRWCQSTSSPLPNAPGAGRAQQRPVRRCRPDAGVGPPCSMRATTCARCRMMYRILNAHSQVKSAAAWRHRKTVRRNWSPPRGRCTLGQSPNSPARPGHLLRRYVMIDIYSCFIVGVHAHARECGCSPKEMMEQDLRQFTVSRTSYTPTGEH